ncbi:MAG: CHAD domain-containing protein [Nocardioidaceae bacterium]|nr:CHAD domain-containing protein [Nocardioidaceae bacterium]
MLDRLTALAETPPWTERAGEPVKRALTASVAHEWKRTRKRLKRADKADTPDERTARLHDVRKAAKRARYAAEPLVPVLGRDAARFVKATKKVQSVLGDHHDTVEARSEVRRLAGTGTSVDETFALGDLHARLGHDLDTFESRFQKAWAKASRKLHRWLT